MLRGSGSRPRQDGLKCNVLLMLLVFERPRRLAQRERLAQRLQAVEHRTHVIVSGARPQQVVAALCQLLAVLGKDGPTPRGV